jgi:hypothetical protein
MRNPQVDQLFHILQWKIFWTILLCSIGGALLTFGIKWLENWLVRTIRSARARRDRSPQTAAGATPPHCPICNSLMVKRTARRGANAGSEFWGCPNYPKCHGTRAI